MVTEILKLKCSCIKLTTIFTILLLAHLDAYSQIDRPDNFKINDMIEVYGKDSLKVYFNCDGKIVHKACALYYRKGRIDSTSIGFRGIVYDYYLDGRVFFKGLAVNGNLEGMGYFYYENGATREWGKYQNNVREGKWLFYYPNGNIEKIYDYVNGEPTVLEAYSLKGDTMVINGSGNFKTNFTTKSQCSVFSASGNLLNGRKEGIWTFNSSFSKTPIATEIYHDGKFIKGKSFEYKGTYEYTTDPRIGLTEHVASESIDLVENLPACPESGGVAFWKYKGGMVGTVFYKDLQQSLTAYNAQFHNQWLIVCLKINKKDQLSEIEVSSSIDDKNLERYVYDCIYKMTEWQTARSNSLKLDTYLFFSIAAINRHIIIPQLYFNNNPFNSDLKM